MQKLQPRLFHLPCGQASGSTCGEVRMARWRKGNIISWYSRHASYAGKGEHWVGVLQQQRWRSREKRRRRLTRRASALAMPSPSPAPNTTPMRIVLLWTMRNRSALSNSGDTSIVVTSRRAEVPQGFFMLEPAKLLHNTARLRKREGTTSRVTFTLPVGACSCNVKPSGLFRLPLQCFSTIREVPLIVILAYRRA